VSPTAENWNGCAANGEIVIALAKMTPTNAVRAVGGTVPRIRR
jgi:hypothetical protein